MTVMHVSTDAEALTMTITSGFAADVPTVWSLWDDPRLLERWWGPPTYPATFVDHALEPGARVTYFMTGPAGDKAYGWWRVRAVDAPSRLELEDGFADETFAEDPDLPTTRIVVAIERRPDGITVMAITTQFPSREAMERLLAMGMDEGMREAVGQIDALLRTH